jgi:transitional endoplasmic reticulum ATPase
MREEKILRVVEAKSKDVGRGVARIDPALMSILGLRSGDYVIIEGKKRTAAQCEDGLPEDENRGVIRIDGVTRKNSGTGLDEKVAARRLQPKQADKVTLAPTEPVKIMGGEEYLSQFLRNRAVCRGDMVEVNIMGRKLSLVVTSFKPGGEAGLIAAGTRILVSEKAVKEDALKVPKVSYEDIGGLKEEVKKVREMIELPLRHPELFERLGVDAPKGVLLHGPPGTGKTLLAKAVASETNANFQSLSGPEIMSKYYGQSEENLREVFKQAEDNAPSIIFIDEIDSIAPKRDEVQGEVERRVVAQLLSLMDGLATRGKVVVIGATNRPNALDPALRRPGRFDREIEIGIPDADARLEILGIHTRGMPLAEDVEPKEVAAHSHGYVGADLASLVKEAAMRALRRVLPDIDVEMEQIPAEVLARLVVTRDDFFNALREMEPSTLREVLIQKPNVRWEQIGGLEGAKQELREVVEWPMKHAKVFKKLQAELPKGILLYGPPGTGKTLLAKAVATEAEANFISVKGPEFLSKWVGESEKAVREVFRKARQAAPCVIFFDEVDAITPLRGRGHDSNVTERVISQLLTELDGLEPLHSVTVIAATNRPDLIDPALLRAGRFDRFIYIPPPEEASRLEILRIHFGGKPLSEEVSLREVAKRLEGFTGADIASVCKEATMLAVRELVMSAEDGQVKDADLDSARVEMKHLDEAMRKVKPLSKVELDRYRQASEMFRV